MEANSESLSLSGNSLNFVEHEGLLLCSQEPVNRPYSEPA